MDRFVVGFAFNETKTSVLLVRKLRPEWQKGFFNGIRGHIEKDESPFDTMRRECKEETGLSLDWTLRGVMNGKNNDNHKFECYIFYAYSQDIFKYQQREDEQLRICNPLNLTPTQVITNLNFLIPYGMYNDGSTYMRLDY